MKVHQVNSRMISGVSYDRTDRKLLVQFRSGQVYEYSVHPRIFTALRKSTSIGKYLGDKVLGKYEPKRLS